MISVQVLLEAEGGVCSLPALTGFWKSESIPLPFNVSVHPPVFLLLSLFSTSSFHVPHSSLVACTCVCVWIVIEVNEGRQHRTPHPFNKPRQLHLPGAC